MSDASAPSIPAQWYPDPRDASQLRYWDGSTWTEHVTPRPASGQQPSAQVSGPVGGLAAASLWLAVALTVSQVLVAVTSFQGERNAIHDARTGDISWGMYDTFGLVLFVVGVPTYVVTCLWLARCRKNVDALRPDVQQKRRRIWIWIGWFVPVVALWFPFQIVRDIGTRSDGRRPPSLGWWWACWLITNAADQIVFRIGLSGEVSAARGLAEFEVVSAVFTIASLFFWIRIIRYIQHDQDELLSRRAS